MSEPSPTSTPCTIRPSTIEVPTRAGVEVDEALVHHGRAGGQVRAEPHPVGVGDPHTGGHHVVGHPGELVHPVHRQVSAGGPLDHPQLVHPLRWARPGGRPGHVGQLAEDAVEVELVGSHQAVGEQVQPEVRVGRVLDRVVQRADHGDHLHGTQTGQGPVTERGRRQVEHVRLVLAGDQRQLAQAQLAGRVPGIEHLLVCGDRSQADAPGGICGRHCYTSRSRPG